MNRNNPIYPGCFFFHTIIYTGKFEQGCLTQRQTSPSKQTIFKYIDDALSNVNGEVCFLYHLTIGVNTGCIEIGSAVPKFMSIEVRNLYWTKDYFRGRIEYTII